MKNKELVDQDTGEVMYAIFPVIPKLKTKRWFMAFQDPFMSIAQDKDLNGETLRVLLYVMSKIDFENYLQLAQKDIAEALGIHKVSVSRSMKVLIGKGIVLEGPKVGQSKTYRLNEHYGWKGKVKNLQKATSDRFKVIAGGKEAVSQAGE